MKHLSSSDNPLFKSLRALAHEAAAVRRLDQAWLEGIHLAASALDAGLEPLALVCTEEGLGDAEIARLAERVGASRVVLLEAALWRQLSAVRQGREVGLLVRRPAAGVPRGGVAVVLDRVQDAGNVGTLLRTAAAAGAGTVYCLRGCAGAWTSKVLRAGMGAHFALCLVEDARWEDIEPGLPRPLYATSGQGTRDLYELDLRGDVTWLFGNEGAGVDPALLARCDAGVRIPQRGAVESLNVAAAAAVCLYEGLRQRIAAGR
ncbi:RNA methyltransferase [Thiomonas sp.]|uniref:TrmH family RNA methyltransferase n=1 Tax=Thiomonas sp. TaxID=2047785 RepID=UPI0026344BCF|nr:RNA methyltransferase [Thiomonas sp.]